MKATPQLHSFNDLQLEILLDFVSSQVPQPHRPRFLLVVVNEMMLKPDCSQVQMETILRSVNTRMRAQVRRSA